MRNNNIQLIVYIGKHLTMQIIPNGNKKVLIRGATHSTHKNGQGEKVYNTQWHDVIAWGGVAEFADKNFVKGSKVIVDGSIEYKTYPDKTGHIRYITQIKAHSLMNLDR
jgi:single-strand DNA-binding protein